MCSMYVHMYVVRRTKDEWEMGDTPEVSDDFLKKVHLFTNDITRIQ
jgi:hypothetical protein